MRTLLVCTAAFLTFGFCQAEVADLRVWLSKYSNPTGAGDNGHCCDGRWRLCQRNGCDHYFIICIDDNTSSNSTENCKYLTTTTGHIDNQNEITFPNKIGDVDNPMKIPIAVVPEKLNFKVRVYDHDSIGSDDFVDFIKHTYDAKNLQLPYFNLSQAFLKGRHTRLDVWLHLTCSKNQYGPLCDKYCSPEGNIASCDEATGQAICAEGWTGDNCTEPASSCADGWLSWSSSCYLFKSLGSTWTEARAFCRYQQSDLVVIDSSDELTFVKGELTNRLARGESLRLLWIGLNDRAQEGKWVWNDNTPVKFQNWRSGEPNNAGNEDCGSIYQTDQSSRYGLGQWNDVKCGGQVHGFICETGQGRPIHRTLKSEIETSCPNGWLSRATSCYLFSTLEKKWVDAQAYCRQQGADLLEVDSWDESTFIKGELIKGYKPGTSYRLLWIGLNDRAREGNWVWNNNSPLKVRNWREGEPNNRGNEDCGAIYQRRGSWWMGRWNDINCDSSKLRFICEKTQGDTDEEGSGEGSGAD